MDSLKEMKQIIIILGLILMTISAAAMAPEGPTGSCSRIFNSLNKRKTIPKYPDSMMLFGYHFTDLFSVKYNRFRSAQESTRFVVQNGLIVNVISGEPAGKRPQDGRDIQSKFLYVMDKYGNLYLLPENGVNRHSTLLAGSRVSAAGHIEIINGVPYLLNAESGHYRLGTASIQIVVDELAQDAADLTHLRPIIGVNIPREYYVGIGGKVYRTSDQ